MTADTQQLSQSPIARKGMLIRKPPPDVFQAFSNPAITTRFWFTKSSGTVMTGAKLKWDWEMFGASAEVSVKEVQENDRIVIAWGRPDRSTTVEFRFIPWEGHTFVQVTESGFGGTADEQVAQALDSTGGFSLVLAAAKALLEHGVVLTVVLDHAPPKGLKL
jgi:uncharacterized protein YndB with AHSA1/START domain